MRTIWRRLFVPWREAAIGSCGNLHNEEFNIFYPVPNMIRVINSKRMNWAGCVSCMEELRNVCNSFIGKHRPRWEDSIKWFLRKYFVRDWTIWFKIWASDSHLYTLYLTYGYLWNRSSDLTEQHLLSQKGLYSVELLLLTDVLVLMFSVLKTVVSEISNQCL